MPKCVLGTTSQKNIVEKIYNQMARRYEK